MGCLRRSRDRPSLHLPPPQRQPLLYPHAVSLVLKREDSGFQRPVYYVSKSLHEAEIRYSPLEKAILAVVHASQKLPYYFQAHMVVVLTQLPLKFVLRTANYTGRIALWNTILGTRTTRPNTKSCYKGWQWCRKWEEK